MRKMLHRAAWITGALLFPLLYCSSPVPGGGSSSEIIIGKVFDAGGSPACSTIVTLYPADYNPIRDSAKTRLVVDTTGTDGAYSMTAPGSTDQYSIVAADMKSPARAMVSGIILTQHTTQAGDAVLSTPGVIVVTAPDTITAGNGYLYIPGTGIAVFLDGRREVVLDRVPAGVIPSINYVSNTSSTATKVLAAGVEVASNDTTALPYTQWHYFRKVFLNTTPSGACVPGDVVKFPALIRLTGDNFAFGQAKNDGSDIRFTKSNGTPLPYEIERWDPGSAHAEIWVRLDTVYGNDQTQSFMMYWGNESAAAQSNGPAVFDTANGFQGVWHLGEAANAVARDATGNHYDGIPSDSAPSAAQGAIGQCKEFNGRSNFIRMNSTASSKLNFPENGTYTVSAWAYADTLDNGFHLIVGKGNEQYFLKLKQSVPVTSMRWEFVEFHDKVGWFITNSIPSAKVWVYIVGVRNGAAQNFYVNGVPVDSVVTLTSSTASRNTGEDVTIGKFLSIPADSAEGLCAFLGMIDEVRIANTANTPDWIKLCYMNQKALDALIKW